MRAINSLMKSLTTFLSTLLSAQLDARQTLRFDVALKLASASQSIEVGGDAGPVINTEMPQSEARKIFRKSPICL